MTVQPKKPQSRFMIRSTKTRMEIFDAICMAFHIDKDEQLNQLMFDFVKENFYILNLDDKLILPKIEKIFNPELAIKEHFKNYL